jgi:3-dehydroquinate dehydratase I
LSLEKKICVSIPLTNIKELESIENKIEKILNKDNSVILEFRFDYLNEFTNLEKILEKISKYKRQSIYTLRSIDEGGKFSEGESARLIIIRKLALAGPMLLDLEYNSISQNNMLADYIDDNHIRTLISWHDYTGTPQKEFLINLIDKMRIFSNFVKVVTTAKSIDDSINIMKLYGVIDSSINLIAFSMGELGIISRILCNIIGDCPFAYCAIEKAVAPGQLTIDQMKSIYSLFHNKLI